MPFSSASKEVRDARDAELLARAAWLHFVGGLTQSEVARRLNVPITRAHRYIARAQAEGLVRIFVDVSSAKCISIEAALSARYNLRLCRVAMDVPEVGALPLRALSSAGADVLMQTILAGEHPVIGIGHGRTIAATVGAMGRVEAGSLRIVSMLGGLTRSFAANPYDVIHRLAEKTGADCYMMPAPIFTNSADDKQVMLAQLGIAATMEMIGGMTLAVVGIGDVTLQNDGATAAALGGPEVVARLHADGARAEILGQFLNADGEIMETEFDARVMAAPLGSLKGRDVIAIAGGLQKKDAVEAALKSGLLTGLIIDEATARALVGEGGESAIAAA